MYEILSGEEQLVLRGNRHGIRHATSIIETGSCMKAPAESNECLGGEGVVSFGEFQDLSVDPAEI
jgi:hypothetical protein